MSAQVQLRRKQDSAGDLVAARTTANVASSLERTLILFDEAVTDWREGRRDNALSRLASAIAIGESVLGEDSLAVGTLLSSLGAWLWKENLYGRAEAVLLRSRAILVSHPDRRRAHVNACRLLGEVYLSTSRYDEATTLFGEALDTYASLAIAQTGEGIELLRSLATAFEGLGELDRATELFKMALAACESRSDSAVPQSLRHAILGALVRINLVRDNVPSALSYLDQLPGDDLEDPSI